MPGTLWRGLIAGVALVAWAVAAPAEPARFDHRAWDRVLQRFVNAQGQVDYAALQKDSAELEVYLAALAQQSPDTTPALFPTQADELAYWLNAYNACVFKGVITYYPIQSVQQARAFAGFFFRDRYTLGGVPMTLHHLENAIIRTRYREPRIHFALNCASQGCPRLRPEAFEGVTLEAVLEASAREFMNDPRHVRLEAGRVKLSSIFKWYQSDFADSRDGLIHYLQRYLLPEAASTLEGKPVAFLPYDWRLNDQQTS